MKSRTKIAAFTLNEMLVVIILSGIVVSMAFSVLRLVQGHMFAIQDNFKQQTEIAKLRQSLWVDFNRSNKIHYYKKEHAIVFASELDSVTYSIADNKIVKAQDTFMVDVKDWAFFFDGAPTNKSQIDAVKITLSKAFQEQQLFIYTYNDAFQYIK